MLKVGSCPNDFFILFCVVFYITLFSESGPAKKNHKIFLRIFVFFLFFFLFVCLFPLCWNSVSENSFYHMPTSG